MLLNLGWNVKWIWKHYETVNWVWCYVEDILINFVKSFKIVKKTCLKG